MTSKDRVPDAALVALAKRRDDTAFRALVERHQGKLLQLASRFAEARCDQEEILQDALFSAWRNLPRFEGRSQFGSWVHRITVNAALMRLRARKRAAETPTDDIEGVLADDHGNTAFHAGAGWARRPDESYLCKEQCLRVECAVQKLAPLLREVFVLRRIDGLSTEETASKLGLSQPAVKTRLNRADAILRKSATCTACFKNKDESSLD